MRKLLIIIALLFPAMFLVEAQQCFAYLNVTSTPNGGCLNCHTFAGGTGNPSAANHATHVSASVLCSSCHPSGVPGKNVTSDKCIVCHPQGNPGQCNLVNLAAHPKTGVQACLSCHATCAPTTTTTPGTTTTTIGSTGCIDNDGDGYGDNCTAGPDCDDNDPTIHEGCTDCTLKITPDTFSRARAVLAPIQFFTIRADRNSNISFSNPICIFWGSEGIDDVIRIKLGEKLIVGFIQVYPNHLTAGNFHVDVTFGDISETRCGPIVVQDSGLSNYIATSSRESKPVKWWGSCGK